MSTNPIGEKSQLNLRKKAINNLSRALKKAEWDYKNYRPSLREFSFPPEQYRKLFKDKMNKNLAEMKKASGVMKRLKPVAGGTGAVLGAAASGAYQIRKAAKRTSAEQDKHIRQIIKQADSFIKAAQARRARRKSK